VSTVDQRPNLVVFEVAECEEEQMSAWTSGAYDTVKGRRVMAYDHSPDGCVML